MAEAQLKFTGNFKRDAAAGTKFWRGGSDLLAKLAEKTAAHASTAACGRLHPVELPRARRKRFLARHAEAVYRKLTKISTNFVRVEDLVYDAAKLVPGLTPTRQAGRGGKRKIRNAKRTASKSIRAFSWRMCWRMPDAGMHLCHAMLLPKPESLERLRRIHQQRRARFRPRGGRAAGQGRGRHLKNPRFLNAEDDDTLDETETAADIAILDSKRDLRAARRRGRSSEI